MKHSGACHNLKTVFFSQLHTSGDVGISVPPSSSSSSSSSSISTSSNTSKKRSSSSSGSSSRSSSSSSSSSSNSSSSSSTSELDGALSFWDVCFLRGRGHATASKMVLLRVILLFLYRFLAVPASAAIFLRIRLGCAVLGGVFFRCGFTFS